MPIPKRLLFLTRPVIVWYVLPWIMLLLVAGTLSQRYIGIYLSQEIFFSSFIVWWGPLPLPGMLTALLVLGLSLFLKLLLKSPWRRDRMGTLVVHLGVLLLLAGGMLTALTAKEGSMVLAEGKSASSFTDYYWREFVVEKNQEVLIAEPFDTLKEGHILSRSGIPFRIRIDSICRNCDPQPRNIVTDAHRDMARKIKLNHAELKVEDEENLAGAEFHIEGASEQVDGIYFTYAPVPHPPAFALGEDQYRISIRKRPYSLPFTVTLEQFEKQRYPGTDMAREFESIVTIRDGALSWQSPIRMNEPLRYRGYTFYQSAFSDTGEETLSILAVVQNTGRAFPYISCLVVCAGLLVHLFVRRRKGAA